MNTVHEWLRTQKAGEIMTKTVECLRPSDRLSDAVSLFLRDQISGAPVVDDSGVCVGVLSTTDIVHYDEKHSRATKTPGVHHARHSSFDTWEPGNRWWCEFGRISEEIQSQLDACVADFMTRDLVSVTEETSLGVLVRQMFDAHVHRILVLDGARRLMGVITTMDVLGALLRASRRE